MFDGIAPAPVTSPTAIQHDDADNLFVIEWAPYVHTIVRRIVVTLDLDCDIEDLTAFGFRGLLEARARFDPCRGVRFSTFAYYRVRGAVLDGVRKMAYLPARAHARRKALVAADALLEEAGSKTAPARTKEQCVARIDDVLDELAASLVLSALGQDEEARSGRTPEDALIAATHDCLVREAVQSLPRRERALVEGVYFGGRQFDEVASDLGISKSWASKLHARAIRVLRRDLARRVESRGPRGPVRSDRARGARGCSDRSA